MKPIGIDLGTTFSAIARWQDTGMVIGPECYYFQNEAKNYIPSKIFIPDLRNLAGDVLYGTMAIRRSIIAPDYFYSAFKRGIANDDPIQRPHGSITPTKLSSMLLAHMFDGNGHVNSVEGANFIPEGVTVSVPYYFKENAKRNTQTALSKALEQVYRDHLDYDDSLNLLTVPEPIAAGLDYAFSNINSINQQDILIFDLGGGTFDVTIYELKNSNQDKKLEFTVLATDGDSHLGGEDFDESIRKFILKKNGIDESQLDKRTLAKFYIEVTEVKCILSSVSQTSILINDFYDRRDLDFTLTDQDIADILSGKENVGKDYISKIEDIIDRCINKAGISAAEIDRVVMVGGSSHIPCIRKMLEQKFSAGKMVQSPKPEETVARGACIYATYLLDKKNICNPNYRRHLHYWDEINIKEKTAHDLGIVTANNTVDKIIYSNKFTPISGTRSYIPSVLNQDGLTATLNPLIVKQGGEEIGSIPVPTIYTHGRTRTQIPISITLRAEPAQVMVIIHVPQGNEDGTDLHLEEPIHLS